MAKDQRLKPKQIVTLLRQIDVLTTNGKTLAQGCKEVGGSIRLRGAKNCKRKMPDTRS